MGNSQTLTLRHPDTFLPPGSSLVKPSKKWKLCNGTLLDIDSSVKNLNKLLNIVKRRDFEGKPMDKECINLSLEMMRLQNEYNAFFFKHNCDPKKLTGNKLSILELGYLNYDKIQEAIAKVQKDVDKNFGVINNYLKLHAFAIEQMYEEHRVEPYGSTKKA